MKARLLTIALGLAITAPGSVGANALTMKTMDQMVQESDVILIGRVVELSHFEKTQSLAIVESISSIKGSGEIKLIYKTGISELDPNCCELGKRYLFFLRRQPDGYFVTVGGRQGAIAAEGP